MKTYLITMCLVILACFISWSVCRCWVKKRPPSREGYYYVSTSKVVHLVLFSDKSPYKDMMNITRPLYRSVPNVTTIYYCYDPAISKPLDYDPEQMILRIRGNETYVPGILLKTLDAFAFALEQFPSAELFIRSNVSTVLDLRKLCKECFHDSSLVYGGCWKNELAWLDPSGGVKDSTWFGTKYASGTCILMRRPFLRQMIHDRARIRTDLVDDLSIGVWKREHAPNIDVWTPASGGKDWFFRNRQANRNNDLVRMKEIVSQLANL